MELRIGSRVGDYEILARIGNGGSGDVFKSCHVLTNRIEALKILHPGSGETPEQVERFLREIRLQASLQHPNIAAVYNAFEADGRLVMAMEYVDGQSLRQLMDAGEVELSLSLAAMCQVLSALEFAHSKKLIHRDIKPENILITSDGTTKITDFGLAKAATGPPSTYTSAPVGSLAYISPEQVRASKTIDGRSDLYSLGAVLYELATGRPPFQDVNGYELMKAHVEQMPPPPSELKPEVAEPLSAAIIKALRKDPAHRYNSATEFRYTLERLRDAYSPGRKKTSSRRTPKFTMTATTRKRILLVVLAALVTAIGVTGSVVTWKWLRPAPRLPELPAATSSLRPPDFAYLKTSGLLESGTGDVGGEAATPTQSSSASRAAHRKRRGKPKAVSPAPERAADQALEKGNTVVTQLVAEPAKTSAAPASPPPPPPVKSVPELKLVASFEADPSAGRVVFGAGGRYLAAYGGKVFAAWNLGSGGSPVKIQEEGPRVAAVVFSPGGKRLFTGDADGAIRIWDLLEGRETATLGHDHGVTALATNPDGNLLIVGLRNKTIRFWRQDPHGGRYKRAFRALKGARQAPVAIAYNRKANLLAAVSSGRQLELWRAVGGGKALHVTVLAGGATAVAISNDGVLLAVAGPGAVSLWRVRSRTRIKTLETGARCHALRFTPNGCCLAAASGGRTVRVWDVISGTPIVEALMDSVVRGVALNGNGTRVAAVDSSGKVDVWRMNETAAEVITRPLNEEEKALLAGDGDQAAPPLPARRSIFRRLFDKVH